MRILVADDEPEVRTLLRLYLENSGYSVTEAGDGQEALAALRDNPPDLCLLDIMMPKLDGYQVLQTLRKQSDLPVLILSAKGADAERILGLNLGADDYLPKPFNPLEVVARVNAVLRRFHKIETARSILQLGELELDVDACRLTVAGEEVPLTSVEYKILAEMMNHPGKVYTKQQLYEIGWGEEYFISDNNIMVCISKLRSKLDADNNRYIRTIRGLGYRMEGKA